jgi:hypothetical protein
VGGGAPGPGMKAAGAGIMFQRDSLANQHEHLAMLVANRAERIRSDREISGPAAATPRGSHFLMENEPPAVQVAVQQVFMTGKKKHADGVKLEPLGTFDNYDHGCDVMGIPKGNQSRFVGDPLSCPALKSKWGRRETGAGGGISATCTADQLENLALWWSIWGEAASLRFMPELLCFVFFLAVQDANNNNRSRAQNQTHLFGHVVKPVFDFMEKQMGQKARGKALDHCKKMNYDDVNEYFCE